MSHRSLLPRVLVGLLALSFPVCRAQTDPTPVIHVNNPPNTPAQQAKHYVILVSLDGFRYDYPTKYGAPHLLAMAKEGASAPDGMLPSYPSLTFPNHLSIVTGLYPEHHGIVGNSFFDPARNDTYVYTQSKTNGDGSWYGGTPLWVLAEQQGMRAACLFWPGSEAEIQGKRPSYYLKYDDKLDDEKRVEQVLAWLKLPPEQRPHFITLYYSNVDHAGHAYGPESDEVRAAVHHVDDMIGELQAGIAASKLPVDLVVVADHGMIALKGDPIDLSAFADLSNVHTEGSLIYAKDEAEAVRIYKDFKTHPDPRFSVYRRAEMPEHLHFNSNAREGDPIVVPNGPYLLTTKPGRFSGKLHGMHGYDPATMPEMKAIFFAEGPDVDRGEQLPVFENVSVYPLVTAMLALDTPREDGKVSQILSALHGTAEKRAGANVQPPRLVHKETPNYTKAAGDAKLSGTVLIALVVDADGNPSQIHVLKGLGLGLDESAIASVKKYRFKPAFESGQAVPVRVNVDVSFRIH